MITEDQKTKIAELKAAIAATAASPSGAPEAVRAAVLELKTELRRSGTTARVLAAALGLHETTLSRWAREATTAGEPRRRRRRTSPRTTSPERAASSFRPVQVTPAATKATAPAATMPAPSARGLRVAHAPSGLVIDGLDVETLVALVRRLS